LKKIPERGRDETILHGLFVSRKMEWLSTSAKGARDGSEKYICPATLDVLSVHFRE